jgi:hypothetical protein
MLYVFMWVFVCFFYRSYTRSVAFLFLLFEKNAKIIDIYIYDVVSPVFFLIIIIDDGEMNRIESDCIYMPI